jgi:hypothetical protein
MHDATCALQRLCSNTIPCVCMRRDISLVCSLQRIRDEAFLYVERKGRYKEHVYQRTLRCVVVSNKGQSFVVYQEGSAAGVYSHHNEAFSGFLWDSYPRVPCCHSMYSESWWSIPRSRWVRCVCAILEKAKRTALLVAVGCVLPCWFCWSSCLSLCWCVSMPCTWKKKYMSVGVCPCFAHGKRKTLWVLTQSAFLVSLIPPKRKQHCWLPGLRRYLIGFAPQAFAPQRQPYLRQVPSH